MSPGSTALPTWENTQLVNGIKKEEDSDTKRLSSVMSPGSTSLPNWDNSQAMSPYMCPDMSSIASGSMMGQNFNNNSRNYDFIKSEPNQCNPNNEYGPNSNPLAHLSDSVNSLDPLNAMEKSLNEQHVYLFFAVKAQAPLLACLIGNKKNDKSLIDWTPEKLTAFNKCKDDLGFAIHWDERLNMVTERIAFNVIPQER